jgi:hypothetical protein
MSEDAKFCPKCGVPIITGETPVTSSEAPQVKLRLAKWESRFVAWLIDIVIVGLIPNALRSSGLGYEFHLWPFE